jgi:transcriptional regulator of acetoin/glycerol metabolism
MVSGINVSALTPQPHADETTGSLDEIERGVVRRTLEAQGGNISAAARLLGVSRNTLYRKLGRL